MKMHQEPVFERAELADVASIAAEFKQQGYEFISINATTCEDHVDLLYAFRRDFADNGLIGRTAPVSLGEHVASITAFYPAAFVFENEIHDLFGVDFDGINIDYGGEFYTVNVAYPMNPRAAMKQAETQTAGEGDDE